MSALEIANIINIVLASVLLAAGVEYAIKLKRSEGKLLEKVRKPLIVRINIMALTLTVFAVRIIIIILENQ